MSGEARKLKAYPHKPKAALLAEALDHARDDYQAGQTKAAAAAAEGRAIFFKIQGGRALEVAALEYGFGGAIAEVRGWLSASCAAAHTAIKLGQPLDPGLHRWYLAQAVLCRDKTFRGQLEGLSRAQFTDATVRGDEIYYLAAEAMRDIARGDLDQAAEACGDGVARIEAGAPKPHEIAAMEAILRLEAAIAAKDPDRLAAAIAARTQRQQAYFQKGTNRNFRAGLLDIEGLGLLKLAREQGLSVAVDSVYLPLELLEA